MNKREQLKRLADFEEARQKWLMADVESALKGTRRDEVLAFLRQVQEEDRADPSVYKIQFMNFRPEQYYDWLLIELEDVASEVPDMSLKKHDALRFIELSFTTLAALEEFKSYLPLGYAKPDDSYEFVERRRDPKTRRWELVDKPVLWEQED